jgi:PAS domain S-box-containing protein
MGMARVAPDMRIIEANDQLGALLHASNAILVGSSVSEWLTPGDTAVVAGNIQTAAGGGSGMADQEGPIRRADGSQVWVQRSATSVRRADGTLDYMLVTFGRHHGTACGGGCRDGELLAGPERLNKMKSEFVSSGQPRVPGRRWWAFRASAR